MSEYVLEITGLNKHYGAQQALRDVSLVLSPGRIAGLLGPNGSGKTTMIKIINGLLGDYSGTVQIGGHEPGVESKKIVSYLPDRMSLPEWLRVEQVVKLFSDFYEDFDREKANDILNALSIPEKKKISALSKGMKEKLQLALAMSRKAQLYVLDEPIAGVDPASRDVILDTILNNYAENGSILLSTHIISEVETIFDDIIFLKEGEVYLRGNAEDLRIQHGKSIDQLFREVYRC